MTLLSSTFHNLSQRNRKISPNIPLSFAGIWLYELCSRKIKTLDNQTKHEQANKLKRNIQKKNEEGVESFAYVMLLWLLSLANMLQGICIIFSFIIVSVMAGKEST